ncbi:MAG TPA: hypothetical protein VNL71_21915 [Chloroflexota bacterium]|nr:hypothetical protein [Chloroflexota bacterium]
MNAIQEDEPHPPANSATHGRVRWEEGIRPSEGMLSETAQFGVDAIGCGSGSGTVHPVLPLGTMAAAA